MVNRCEPLQRRHARTSQRCCQAWTKRYVTRAGCSNVTRRRCCVTGAQVGPNRSRYLRGTWEPRISAWAKCQASEPQGEPLGVRVRRMEEANAVL
jgi:hypothetical protein